MVSTTLSQHWPHILRRTILCKMDRKTITLNNTAYQTTLCHLILSCGGLLRTMSTGYLYLICQTCNKGFMLLSKTSHYRFLITHGTRLTTVSKVLVPLMQDMFKFMARTAIRKFQVIILCNNWFHLHIRISSEVTPISLLYL